MLELAKYVYLLYGLLALKYYSAVCGQSQCTNKNVEECYTSAMDPVEDLIDELELIPTWDTIEIEAVCNAFYDLKDCYSGIRPDCEICSSCREPLLTMDTIEDKLNYICVEKRQEYLQNRGCYSQPEVMSDMRECNATFYESISTASGQIQKCRSLNELLDCVNTTTITKCGSDEATWAWNFIYREFEKVMDYITCNEGICSLLAVDTCTDILRHAEPQDNATTLVIPHFSQEELNTYCSALPKYESCMEPLKPHCESQQRHIFNYYLNSSRYLCEEETKEGLNEYLSYGTCWKHQNVQADTTNCFDNLATNLRFQNCNDGIESCVCRYTDEYLSCMDNVIVKYCGTDAADWLREYETFYLSYIRSFYSADCSKEEPGVNGILIGIIVICVIVLVAIVAVVIGCIIYMKKTRGNKSSYATEEDDAAEGSTNPAYEQF